MKFNHFSNWLTASINLENTYGTVWTESNYWMQKVANVSKCDLEQMDKLTDTTLESFCKEHTTLAEFTKKLGLAKNRAELKKEYIFEEVRLTEFPDKPSRRKCMFLIPMEMDFKEYAKKMGFLVENKTFLEIDTLDKSNLHYANIERLNCNGKTHQEKIDAGREYWKGTKEVNFNTEILFEGEFKITKIH